MKGPQVSSSSLKHIRETFNVTLNLSVASVLYILGTIADAGQSLVIIKMSLQSDSHDLSTIFLELLYKNLNMLFRSFNWTSTMWNLFSLMYGPKTCACLQLSGKWTILNMVLPPSHIMPPSWFCHVCQWTILNINIFNNLLKKFWKFDILKIFTETNPTFYMLYCIYTSRKIELKWTIDFFKLNHLKWDGGSSIIYV